MSHYTQVLLMHATSSTHKTKGGWYKFQATLGYVKKGRKQGGRGEGREGKSSSNMSEVVLTTM